MSSEAVIRRRPFRENDACRTPPMCPFRTVDPPLAEGVHSLTVRSFDADATRVPSGENSAWWTVAVWPLNFRAYCCAARVEGTVLLSWFVTAGRTRAIARRAGR